MNEKVSRTTLSLLCFWLVFLSSQVSCLKPALDKKWPSLFQILANYFGLPAKCVHVNETNFFLHFTGFGFPLPVDSQGNLRDGRPLGRVTQFRIAGQIAGDDDFVEIGLAMTQLLFRGFRLRRFGEQHPEHFIIQAELGVQLRDDRGRPGKNDVRVKTGGVPFVRDARKILSCPFSARFRPCPRPR